MSCMNVVGSNRFRVEGKSNGEGAAVFGNTNYRRYAEGISRGSLKQPSFGDTFNKGKFFCFRSEFVMGKYKYIVSAMRWRAVPPWHGTLCRDYTTVQVTTCVKLKCFQPLRLIPAFVPYGNLFVLFILLILHHYFLETALFRRLPYGM